jgi:hypothetical protein
LASGFLGTGWSEASAGRRQGETLRPESSTSRKLDDRIRMTANEPDLVTHSWNRRVARFWSVPQERILHAVNPPARVLGYGKETPAIADSLPYSLLQNAERPAWNLACNITPE